MVKVAHPQMECMKQEMSSFFTEHTQALASLRGTADAGFCALQAENEKLKQKINAAGKKHEAVSIPPLAWSTAQCMVLRSLS